jgi:hypothetical protein
MTNGRKGMEYDYVVWLKSGESLAGTAEESEIDKLIAAWKRPLINRFCSVLDSDGVTIFRATDIEAIAKNTPAEYKATGFMKGS